MLTLYEDSLLSKYHDEPVEKQRERERENTLPTIYNEVDNSEWITDKSFHIKLPAISHQNVLINRNSIDVPLGASLESQISISPWTIPNAVSPM